MVLEGMVPGIADAVIGTGADHHLGSFNFFQNSEELVKMRFSKPCITLFSIQPAFFTCLTNLLKICSHTEHPLKEPPFKLHYLVT